MKDGIIRLLAIGDVVGPGAVNALIARLPAIRRSEEVDFCIANGENACVGNGLDPASAKRLLSGGVDAITTGNHVWRKRELCEWLNPGVPVLRPANYPSTNPGRGSCILPVGGRRILVMNLMGVVYTEPLENPFFAADRLLAEAKGQYDIAVLDFHAEATGEKRALACYLDGRISVLFGTHTHVPTADEQILPGGTGYITDLGMTGPENSVLGIQPACIIRRLTTSMPTRFEIASGEITAQGALFDIDAQSGHTRRVCRLIF